MSILPPHQLQRHQRASVSILTSTVVPVIEAPERKCQHSINLSLGHDCEVTHLCWNPTYTQWVSGGDDCTIKTWTVSDSYLNMATTTTSTQVGTTH